MSDLRWRLPGVHSFIQRVTENLDAGTNVIIHCPPNAPEGLLDAIRDLSNEDYRHLQWLSVDASDWDHSTSVSIANCISLADVGEAAGVASARDLASHGQQRVYAIENLSKQCWPQFIDFLERFRLANHERDEHDRDVFLVNANAAFTVPDFDVGLRVIEWREVVREIDSRLFLEFLNLQTKNLGLESAVKMSIATELAGSDLNLLEKLAMESLESLLSPEPMLRQLAESFNWCSPDCNSWSDGGREMFRSRTRVHSLVAVLLSDSNEIRKRVWHGQLTVVFPYLEERRIHILSRIRSFLGNANLRDQQGNPTDLEELELGSIYYFIRNSGAPTSIKDEVRLLRDLRHELAHLRPIELSLMGRFLRYTENASSHTV